MPLRNLSKNERRLIALIFRNRGIARVELANQSDLTGASVTRLTSGLIDEGLLKENVLKDGARGQPKKILSLCHDRLISTGFYIKARSVDAVMINLHGKVLDQRTLKTGNLTAKQLVEIVHDTTNDFFSKSGKQKRLFAGAGVSLPGNFGAFETQLKAHESFPSLDGDGLRTAIDALSDWDIFLENDGTSVALGEYLFGKHNVESLFLLHIGYGLGGGAVVNGRPFRGAYGNACLPGALFPYDGPRPTLQDFEISTGVTELAFEDPAKLTQQHQAEIVRWTQRAADQIAHTARIISGLFDPEVVVLGGALHPELLKNISNIISGSELEGPSRGLQVAPIRATHLGRLNGPVGAASVPFFERFFPGSRDRT